ncbi:MAG TPA: hypothetical protein VFU93_02155 [Acidimicrobiales bacterium]|nr:hypothetical protein [Acidimicrobiales bacterium]
MTEHDDPFDRAVEREQARQRWADRAAENRQKRPIRALQRLALVAIPLPLHLWLVDWDKTVTVAIHLGLITLVAMFAASAWIGRDRPETFER